MKTMMLWAAWAAAAAVQSIQAAPRVATSDWAVSETLIALGAPPVAAGDKSAYQIWVNAPRLPETTADSGVRMQPNLEYLHRIKPDFFIQGDFYASVKPQLLKIAPVHTVNFADANGITWPLSVRATEQTAYWVGKEARAKQLIAQAEQQFAAQKKRVAAFGTRPIAVVQFIDPRHLRIYGKTASFQIVLDKLGLKNAWRGESNQWGFVNISLADLARLPENTLLIIVKPHPANVGRALQHSVLWQRLPFAQAGNRRIIAPAWAYGGIPSMRRFGDLLTAALAEGREEAW